MKTPILLLAITYLFLQLYSCQSMNTDPGNCTEIFKSTHITIEGLILDDYYTVRISNNDTIRPLTNSAPYSVLNDQYKQKLANSRDSFHFIGLINDSIVVMEPFVFSADHCHIHYISGKQTLNF